MDAKNMKTALTIAGSDSSGGAGIRAPAAPRSLRAACLT